VRGPRRRRPPPRTGRAGRAGRGPGRRPAPRHEREVVRRRPRPARPARRTWLQRLLIGSGVAVVVVAVLGVAGASYVMRAIGHIDRYDGLDVDAASGGPENYLVVGSDSRAQAAGPDGSGVDGQRSDTIMVVRIDPSSESAAVLALPRDLVVPISGSDERARINSAYNDGRQVLVDTIRDNFGIDVNHYVEVDFQGFRRLVDAVGGIEIYLDTAIKDTASGLFVEDHGCVNLDGDQALAYARSRHLQLMTPDGWSRPDPTADLGRIQRQQLFIRQALSTALAAARSNPLRFRDLLDIGTSSVGIDGETEPMELVQRFRDFDADGLATYSLPVVPSGDGATLELDEDVAEPVLELFRGDGSPAGEGGDGDESDSDGGGSGAGDDGDVAAVDPASVTVTVLNGTHVNGQARDAASAFAAAGFHAGAPDDAGGHDHTTVYYADGERAVAERVAQHLNGPAELRLDHRYDLTSGEVVVVTGEDWEGAERERHSASERHVTAATAPPQPSTSSQEAGSEYTVGEPPPGVDCG
jgi:LCP family protein required for cell wall assembly